MRLSCLNKLILSLAVPALFAACERPPDWRAQSFEARRPAHESPDIELPARLWDRLEKTTTAQAEKAASKSRPIEFAPLKAYFYEKTPGVLARKAIEIDFDEGGGELDLAEFLSGRAGSFYFSLAPTDGPEDGSFDVYFLSDSPEKQIGGRRHGAGCQSYFDVTKFVHKSMKDSGILVNTKEFRHAYALGGTFFVAFEKGGRLKVSRLTLHDSRAPQAKCPARKVGDTAARHGFSLPHGPSVG